MSACGFFCPVGQHHVFDKKRLNTLDIEIWLFIDTLMSWEIWAQFKTIMRSLLKRSRTSISQCEIKWRNNFSRFKIWLILNFSSHQSVNLFSTFEFFFGEKRHEKCQSLYYHWYLSLRHWDLTWIKGDKMFSREKQNLLLSRRKIMERLTHLKPLDIKEITDLTHIKYVGGKWMFLGWFSNIK